MSSPITVLHIITGLNPGGAEMMLLKLLSSFDKGRIKSHVVSLTGLGTLGSKIQSLGYSVESLGMKRGIPNPFGLMRLIKKIRAVSPDLVQTWLYHSDLLGGLAARVTGNLPVVWNIRQSNLSADVNKSMSLFTARLCAFLSSRIPQKIICNSTAALENHVDFGYEREKITIIPNGFEPDVFCPDPQARQQLREGCKIPDDAFLIGMLARFDPQKDHHNFFQAAGLVRQKHPHVSFLLAGEGMTRENPQVWDWVQKNELMDHCYFLGRRDDVSHIQAALDVGTLSSCGESFPNAIGEAMACEVPCVVTDVGDSAHLVGETGLVVPPRDPLALAAAWEKMITMDPAQKKAWGQAARKRIEQFYDIRVIARHYEDLYASILQKTI